MSINERAEIDHLEEVGLTRFNPYHARRGRSSSANSAASFTYAPGKSKAHDLAIAREKQRQAQQATPAPQATQTQATPTSMLKDEGSVEIKRTLRIAQNTMGKRTYYTQEVLEAAESSGKPGELVLSYATPKNSAYRHNGNRDDEFELRHGLYQTSNSSGINQSVGIDWDKVETVRGQTYSAQSFLRGKGFRWDSDEKIYTKKPVQAVSGVYTIPRGGSLPSDLSGITRISGDTFANKDKIKAAGFKWDPNSKAWVKPGVTKSADRTLLDDEPAPYDYIQEVGK